ncbi:hypothetical protein BRC84_03505 [Halobacteriales archaeon QS_1_68_44]|nr:MAG: hypothetical protein BRC84_03505 [Halobacteriales archaeon QS_1_68_44]
MMGSRYSAAALCESTYSGTDVVAAAATVNMSSVTTASGAFRRSHDRMARTRSRLSGRLPVRTRPSPLRGSPAPW